MPDGRISFTLNSAKRIEVWVCDRNGQGLQMQENPFDNNVAPYSFIEPIADNAVLVGAFPADGDDGFI